MIAIMNEIQLRYRDICDKKLLIKIDWDILLLKHINTKKL